MRSTAFTNHMAIEGCQNRMRGTYDYISYAFKNTSPKITSQATIYNGSFYMLHMETVYEPTQTLQCICLSW